MNKDVKTQVILGVAVFLTLMFLMNRYMPATQLPEDKGTQNTGAPAPESPLPKATQLTDVEIDPSTDTADATVKQVNDIKVVSKQYTAVFSTRGAAMQSYTLNNYYNLPPENKGRINLPVAAVIKDKNYSLAMGIVRVGKDTYRLTGKDWKLVLTPEGTKVDGVKSKGSKLIFQTTAGKLKLSRVYDFASKETDGDFGFNHYLIIENTTGEPIVADYSIAGPAGIVPDDLDKRFGNLNGVSAYLDSSNSVVKEETALTKLSDEQSFIHNDAMTAWMGLHNRFFASLLMSNQPETNLSVSYEALTPSQSFYNSFSKDAQEWLETTFKAHEYNASVWLSTNIFEIPANRAVEHSYRYYGGPMDDRIANAFSSQLDSLVTYSWSWLGSISNFLILIMEKIVSVVGNYGIAIILLTIFVKLCMLPLTRKSMRSQHKMQQVQPLIKELKEKYKNDPKRQQAETMRVFKENGVSPVGGCLPMVIQLPIFFALYGAFSKSFLIRQQDFIPGWINDLSQPDHLFHLPFEIPFFNIQFFNLLPVIYLLMQLLHMHMMPKSTDPQQQQQQKMMKYMPIIFVFIFYSMPSGLVLYFVTQSFLTVIEHYFIKRNTDHEAIAGVETGKNPDGSVKAGTGIQAKKKKKSSKK